MCFVSVFSLHRSCGVFPVLRQAPPGCCIFSFFSLLFVSLCIVFEFLNEIVHILPRKWPHWGGQRSQGCMLLGCGDGRIFPATCTALFATTHLNFPAPNATPQGMPALRHLARAAISSICTAQVSCLDASQAIYILYIYLYLYIYCLFYYYYIE